MFGFGVRNLRRLKDVEPLSIRPITLLVGRNSSGKSSYLRCLPLIRQSLLTRTSAPILWYGDLVDFGSFDNCVSSRQKNASISFLFQFEEFTVRNNVNMYAHSSRSRSNLFKNVRLEIEIVQFREKTRISAIRLHLLSRDESTFDLIIDEQDKVTSFHIDGIQQVEEIKPYSLSIRSTSLVPEILINNELRTSVEQIGLYPQGQESWRFYESLKSLLKPYMDQRLKTDKLDLLVAELLLSGFPERETIRGLARGKSKILAAFIMDLVGSDVHQIYPKVEMILKANTFASTMRSLSLRLRNMLSSTLYIGPARVRNERYYRYQDLSVSEIDPDGKNFPVFLNALTSRQLGGFSNWVRDIFGYRVAVVRERDHVSISLVTENLQSNIVDVGYGVSQILPVLGQIWWAKNRPKRRENNVDPTILVIEQPELHLHPAHQALLADALVGMTAHEADGQERPEVHYVVETHSETLVNRLGELIAQKKVNQKDVQIALFEQSRKDEDATVVRSVYFDTEGSLVNWPYGFFQPAM